MYFCDSTYPIVDGIVRLKIEDASGMREVSQWEEFAATEGWLEPNKIITISKHFLPPAPTF